MSVPHSPKYVSPLEGILFAILALLGPIYSTTMPLNELVFLVGMYWFSAFVFLSLLHGFFPNHYSWVILPLLKWWGKNIATGRYGLLESGDGAITVIRVEPYYGYAEVYDPNGVLLGHEHNSYGDRTRVFTPIDHGKGMPRIALWRTLRNKAPWMN